MTERDTTKATRMMHGIGRFFIVIGVLNFVLAAIGLVALLATGFSGQGLALVAAAIGSGMAWSFIGNAMQRLAL